MWLLATTKAVVSAPPELDRLMLFGFLAAFATLVVGLHAKRSRPAQAALAICLAATAVYAFMLDVWPIAIMQGIWAVAVLRHSLREKTVIPRAGLPQRRICVDESRMSRMFGASDV
jgi:hypothetical protein